MKERAVSVVVLMLLLTSMLTSISIIQPVEAEPSSIIVPDDYPTIQEAIDAAIPGDTVYVREGTYCDNVVIDKTLSLIGEGRRSIIHVQYGFPRPFRAAVDIIAADVTIEGFTIRGGYPAGVSLFSNARVLNNNITGNYVGIASGSSCSDVLISGNSICKNAWGIEFCTVSDSAIFGNDITENSMYGVKFAYQGNNAIYHNNIVSNNVPAYVYESINLWDDGYPSGGNYWSGYTGVDANGDGIGDTPVVIDADNIDRYPLMNLWIPPTAQKTLTVYSSPSGVPFTANGIDYTTPWSGTFNTGDSVSLEMPSIYSAGDPRYYWDKWSDGVTSHARTIVMNSDATVTGCYTGPYYELTVASTPMAGIPFTVNGASETTSYSKWLYQGYYTIEMPATYNGYAWQHWLEDDDTNRIRSVTLTYSAIFTAVYAVPDFSVSHDPETYELQPRTISPGQSVTFSISVQSLCGFNEEVSLSYSVTSNTIWRYGDLTLTLDPSLVTPQPNGAAESTLTVSTSRSLENAIYTIAVWGQSAGKSRSTSITMAVARYELFYEIDYMEGHRPRDPVLKYIQDYYINQGISLSFIVNDTVPYDPEVTNTEFWLIESKFNNMGDDSANGNHKNGVYHSEWKWILYGEKYGDPNYAGFCWVPMGLVRGYLGNMKESMTPKDSTSGGNYLFITERANIEVETVTLMHEMGHSIGIFLLKYRPLFCDFQERYDTDPASVMTDKYSYNAGIDPHYSEEYWEEKDITYYRV